MGCATSSEVPPAVVTTPAMGASDRLAEGDTPALRTTPQVSEGSRGLLASRTFATNPHMDMTFSVLHDPSISAAHEASESSQARNMNPLRASRSSIRPNDVSSTTRGDTLAVRRGVHGSRGGGSRNTQLALVIASPGASRVTADAGVRQTTSGGDGFPTGALQCPKRQSSSSQGTSATNLTPFTFENVKKYTEFENDNLRALAKAGGPPVKGYPRTWLELMNMWVADLPDTFDDIPASVESEDSLVLDEGASTPAFLASARSNSMSADGDGNPLY